MSRDWTPEELQAASAAMKNAGQMSYEEFNAETEAKEKIERFAKKQKEFRWPCPRCGCWAMDANPERNALSRRVDVYICDRCGTQEAIEDFAGGAMLLSEWQIVCSENWPL